VKFDVSLHRHFGSSGRRLNPLDLHFHAETHVGANWGVSCSSWSVSSYSSYACGGSLFYGEFGLPEPVAVLDTLGVDAVLRHRKVGSALLRQLVLNLRALGIERVQTEVDWTLRDLLAFFAASGLAPAPRFCLELQLGRG